MEKIVWDRQVDECENRTTTSLEEQVVWICPSIWLSGETIFWGWLCRLKLTQIQTRRTNGHILTSKGSGTNQGSVVLWVIKMAEETCKVTKLEADSTGSKSFVFKIFCLSVFIWIQDGQNKMTCPSRFNTKWTKHQMTSPSRQFICHLVWKQL